ncbi:MAG TPA: hypothetical protein DD435_11590 [Cyanobacteria bacterium UBA8530]|nr:hypothetical protein [Cyanobacteria bacterium UBA8530]
MKEKNSENALFLDDCLFDFLKEPRQGRIHGIHRRALSLDCGELITFFSENEFTPYSLVVPVADFRRLPLSPSFEVNLDSKEIRFEKIAFDLSRAEKISPPFPEIVFHPRRLLRNLDYFERYVEGFGRFDGYRLLQPRIMEIQESEDYSSLMGVGLGLTPSGDDFLMGLFLALYGFSCAGFELPLRKKMQQTLLFEGTTRESLHLLSMARTDRFSHAWIRLIGSLFCQESLTIESEAWKRSNVSQLLKRGATSGTDTAMGLIHGLRRGFAEMTGRRL